MMSARSAAVALLGVACATVGGCGTQPSPSVPGSRPPSAGWKSPAGATAEPQPLRFALVSADGRRITVNAEGGGCTADWRLVPTETASTVTLRLTEYRYEGGPCAAVAILRQRTTTLQSPLAARRLVDGPSGKAITHFDGRKLATVQWLPAGASAPEDRPDGAGWIRVYRFPAHPAEAPVWIEQSPGNLLGEDRFHPGMGTITTTTVHGRPAGMIAQYDDHGVLLQDQIGWYERGYTYSVTGRPTLGSQQPFPPHVLKRIADAMRPPAA